MKLRMNKMDNTVLIRNETSSSNFKKKCWKLLTNFLIPIAFAVIILFTSGYAKTTSRQGSFSHTVLLVLGFAAIVLGIIALLSAPIESYVKLLHPRKNRLFKDYDLYLYIIPIILFLGLLVYYFISGNDIYTLAHYVALMIFGFSFGFVIPFKTFAKFFNKTVLFIAIFSVIVFVIMLFAEKTQFFTSTFCNVNDSSYRSLLGIYFRIDVGEPRNYGPFWEPGIFSLILLVAIIFELFNKKPNITNIIIFVIAIGTTFSTSSILLLPFCVSLFFALKNNKKWFYITLPIAGGLSGLFILLGNPSFHIPVISNIFSKFFSNNSGGSFTTRLISPLYGIYLFGKSFPLGYGPNIFDAKYETLVLFSDGTPIAQTSTVGWLAGSFGVVGLFFIIAAFFSLFSYIKARFNVKSAIMMTAFAFVIINCEPMYAFSIFWIIMMYPLAYEAKTRFARNNVTQTPVYRFALRNKSTNSLAFSNLSWSLVIKILTLVIGLLMYPMYIKYFGNKTSVVDASGVLTTQGAVVLGLWLVILQILSWVLMFDIGIGNGLKTKLVESFSKNDTKESKKLISCSYISNLAIISLLLIIGIPIIFQINFNNILNISEAIVPVRTLQLAFALAFISICLEFALKVVLNIYQALQKQVVASVLPLISTIILLIFVSVARFESMETALLVISGFYIVSVNLPLIILTVYLFSTRLKECRPSFKDWSFKTVKVVLALGLAYFLIQIFLLVINSTNKVLISNVFGPSMVTDYEPYLKIFSAICALASAISLPIWTLIIRADVKGEYQWLKKVEKLTIVFVVIFALGCALAACLLQYIFDFWLKSESFQISYQKAFIFAIWAVAFVWSYFTTGISNGLKILKPQIIILGIGSILKIPAFYLIHFMFPSIDWSILLIIDTSIIAGFSLVMTIINHRAINKRIASLEEKN